jgi:hypothetical protein
MLEIVERGKAESGNSNESEIFSYFLVDCNKNTCKKFHFVVKGC